MQEPSYNQFNEIFCYKFWRMTWENVYQRNWVFAMSFLIPIPLQSDGVDLWYFKLLILSDQTFWNIKGLQQQVVKQ